MGAGSSTDRGFVDGVDEEGVIAGGGVLLELVEAVFGGGTGVVTRDRCSGGGDVANVGAGESG